MALVDTVMVKENVSAYLLDITCYPLEVLQNQEAKENATESESMFIVFPYYER